MGFQWGNGDVFFPGLQMVSSSSRVKHHDFVEIKRAEKSAYKWHNKGSCLVRNQEVCYSPGSQRHLMSTQGAVPGLLQYWCPCDGWREEFSHTPAFTDTRSSAAFAPKFLLPKLEPPLPALFLLVSQLSSLSIPPFWFHFCCLLYTSTFLLYPILWVIPVDFYSSVFLNVLPFLPWLFCSYCWFSH